MNNQEIFNTVWEKLTKQGKRAYNMATFTCMYKIVEGEQVLRCAVGHLIPDEEYRKEFEGKSCDAPMVFGGENPIFIYITNKGYDAAFLGLLQQCHDYSRDENFVQDFQEQMRRVAEDYCLTVPSS